MYWLGIDFESTGLDITKERITEVGAVVWDTNTHRPVRVLNFFMWDETYPPIPELITKLTGIGPDYYKYHHLAPAVGLKALAAEIEKCDYIMAHNGTNFDFPLLKAEWARNAPLLPFVSKPTIDTSVDIPYPEEITTRKLVHLAAEHGFVNPFAHRAVFDVLTMLTVASRYPVDEVIRFSQSPSILIKANVSRADKEKAKVRGYRWNPETFTWHKTIKEFQLEQEKREAGFDVTIIKG